MESYQDKLDELTQVDLLIGNSEIDKAIAQFMEIIGQDSEIYHDVLLLQSNYSDFKQRELKGTVTGRDSVRNTIVERLIKTVAELGRNIKSQYHEPIHKKSASGIYELLLDLDFHEQTDRFQRSIKESKGQVISFLIRANPGYGQRWLYNRFIKQHSARHAPITIDMGKMNLDLEGFINTLGDELVEDYDIGEDLDTRTIQLKQSLCSKVATNTQFIVIENASNFVHSPGFLDFYKMLSRFNLEITINKKLIHNCIFFFVENQSTPYACDNYFCSSELEPEDFIKHKDFKIFGLPEIEPFDEECLNIWLNKNEIFKSHLGDCKSLLEEFNGHPMKTINFIREKISEHNFEQCLIC